MTRKFTDQNGHTVEVHGTHRCYACGAYKPRDAFYTDRGRYTGISSRCKPCCTSRTLFYSWLHTPWTVDGEPLSGDMLATFYPVEESRPNQGV